MDVFNGCCLIQLKKYWNFLLQLESPSSKSEIVCGFSIISVLKGIMMSRKYQRAHAFC